MRELISMLSNRLLLLLCFLPFVHPLIYYSFVVRAIIKIGRIPSWNDPDPKELGFTTHRDLVYNSADIVAYGICVFVLLYFILSWLKKLTVSKMHLKLFLIGISIFIFSLVVDPFMAWFAD